MKLRNNQDRTAFYLIPIVGNLRQPESFHIAMQFFLFRIARRCAQRFRSFSSLTSLEEPRINHNDSPQFPLNALVSSLPLAASDLHRLLHLSSTTTHRSATVRPEGKILPQSVIRCDMKFGHYPKEDRHENLCKLITPADSIATLLNIHYLTFLEQSNAKMPITGTLRATVPPFRWPRFRYEV